MIPLRFVLRFVAIAAILPATARLSAQAAPKEKGKLNQYGNPMKIPPRPTKASIDEGDLRSRLYIFADDSMLGRQINTIGNKKGTDYIASEVKRIGLEPAGDNGTYFQTLPFASRYYSSESQLTVGGKVLKWGSDVLSAGGTLAEADFKNVQVIYGGVAGDTTRQIAAGLAVGRVVLLSAAEGSTAGGAAGGGRGRGGRGAGGGAGAAGGGAGGGRGAAGGGTGAGATGQNPLVAQLDSLTREANRLKAQIEASPSDSAARRQLQQLGQAFYNAGAAGTGGRGGGGRGGAPGGATSRFAGAVAVLTVGLDEIPAARRDTLMAPPQRATLQNPGPAPLPGQALGSPDAPPTLLITRAAAEQLMGVAVNSSLSLRAAGRMASGKLVVASKPSANPEFARNVVAILRGTDPTLKAEYVAIGAHNDHIGFTTAPVDHDSLEAYLNAQYKMRMADGKTVVAPSAAMRDSAVKSVNMAAIRKANGPARLDSVRNGADDDGSGSMAVLEIAEALANAPVKQKRSIIFVWHTGEESGLQGSNYFTNHPTVPREAIVAQINIDMIGRGRADDLPGGGPDYLGVVGSNKLSGDLAKMVADVNTKQSKALKLDYQFDEPSLWDGYNNIYGRSDHANYARYNIPIAFFFTGLHRDYHQLTDEPQYIDYPHYSRITNYIRDLMVEVANNPQRPRLDKGPAQ